MEPLGIDAGLLVQWIAVMLVIGLPVISIVDLPPKIELESM